MLLDAKEKFLYKSAKNTGAEKLYDRYLEIIRDKPSNVCEKSIDYLRAFVQYSPNECLRIIRANENNYFTLLPWGDEYLYLLTSIAAYHLDRNEKALGLIWAVKALDLVDYFAPTIKKVLREEILYKMLASSMVCAHPKDFNQFASDCFFLDWEVKRFYYCGHQNHFNDNVI